VKWNGSLVETVGLEAIGWGTVGREKFAVRVPVAGGALQKGARDVAYDPSEISLFDRQGVRI
jgi:hypothetical protein